MHIFQYGDKETDWLKRRDKKLGAAIEEIGMIERAVTPDLFTALIWAIVEQQIAIKAARTVCGRLLSLTGSITPETILAAGVEKVQQCGMSTRKAGYIISMATSVAGGELDLCALESMSDAEVIAVLSSFRGLGVWTAEMMLIFSLRRPDVVSWGDLAIRRGIMRLYGLTSLDKARFDKYRKRYSPHGSVASLYLWRLGAAK